MTGVREAGLRDARDGAGDALVLARIAGGDVSALGVLFDRYQGDVRRVIARLGVRAGDVDDLVQATFLDVLPAARAYDGRACAKPWLLGLAVMIVRRHRRSLARFAARIAAFARMDVDAPATPETNAGARKLMDRTARALDALSDKKREVLVLITVEGLSGDEVASLLQIPVATVWTRLHHARKELNEAVFEEPR